MKETDEIILNVPFKMRKGTLRSNQHEAIESAVNDLNYIKSKIGIKNFKDSNILDIGCGVKYSQAILQQKIPIRSYWGLDVDKKMIYFLNHNVDDPIMNYRVVPFYNEMYNKKGKKMTKDSKLPSGKRKFDLILLLSVFTHFEPTDFQNMLHILKRSLSKKGVIFFSVFINNEMKERFKDKHKDKPLLKAVYQQKFVDEMINKAGLKIKAREEENEVFKTKHQYFCVNKYHGR